MLCVVELYAQPRIFSSVNDTVTIANDSITESEKKVYSTIHDAASKRKWTKTLYDFVFSNPNSESILPVNEKKSIEEQYIPYTNRPIRNVQIISLSPFGTDIQNPDSVSTSSGRKTLNALHRNTYKFIIDGNLRFKKGDLVNPWTIADNEAYLRGLGFISDARILIDSVTLNDSVDITVVVRDKFSLGFNLHSITRDKFDMEVYDQNFMGLGNRLGIEFMHNRLFNPSVGYGITYANSNFFRTFINTKIAYLKDFTAEMFKVSAERPLQVNLKYLGEINYQWHDIPVAILRQDTVLQMESQDFSASLGRAFNIGDPQKSGNKFVIISRFIKYQSLSDFIKPEEHIYYPYQNRDFWISSFTVFNQRYHRTQMLYNFGNTEDIAYGYNITAQLGYENHHYFKRMYASIEASRGKRLKAGYLYLKAGYGTFFRDGENEQGVVKLFTGYYSPLLQINRSFFRQFASVDISLGVKRLNSEGEQIYFSQLTTFNTGAYNAEANGLRRFAVNMESDWFTPLKILGFRIVTFGYANWAWLGSNNQLLDNRYFSGYGIGIRTRNEQLVFKTIELKFGWYPQLTQSSISDYYNFSSSDPKISPNFKPGFPNIIPFQ